MYLKRLARHTNMRVIITMETEGVNCDLHSIFETHGRPLFMDHQHEAVFFKWIDCLGRFLLLVLLFVLWR